MSLPGDIWAIIVLHFDEMHRLPLRLVCRQLHRVVDSMCGGKFSCRELLEGRRYLSVFLRLQTYRRFNRASQYFRVSRLLKNLCRHPHAGLIDHILGTFEGDFSFMTESMYLARVRSPSEATGRALVTCLNHGVPVSGLLTLIFAVSCNDIELVQIILDRHALYRHLYGTHVYTFDAVRESLLCAIQNGREDIARDILQNINVHCVMSAQYFRQLYIISSKIAQLFIPYIWPATCVELYDIQLCDLREIVNDVAFARIIIRLAHQHKTARYGRARREVVARICAGHSEVTMVEFVDMAWVDNARPVGYRACETRIGDDTDDLRIVYVLDIFNR